MSGPLRAGKSGVVLSVHAQPGAGRDGVAGLHGERLRVRTAAPPVDGRANERLAELLADAFGLKRGAVALVAGATSRRKEFALEGLPLDEARKRLDALLARPS